MNDYQDPSITPKAIAPALERQVGGNHYKGFKIQPIEFAQANNLPPMEFSVIKYTCRHAGKNGKQDLEKAIHYLEMMIDYYYSPEAKPAKLLLGS